MGRTAALLTALALCSFQPRLRAQALLPLKHTVVFNNNGRKPPTDVYPLFRLSEAFALVEDFYSPATLDATLTDNLARSRLLYVGQYCNEAPLFADPEACSAIRGFLERGGVLFLDYGTGSRGIRFKPETVKFLKSVGVTPPEEFQTGYGRSIFAAEEAHPVLAGPAPLGGRDSGHYGWWEKWSPQQVALAHDAETAGKGTFIAQSNVLGKGTVMFNQVCGIFRAPQGVYFDAVRNIVAYAYGAEGAGE
ncbi:MAG: hypothetical protein HOJ57_06225 [Lentisphaerae bacterium]|jgi:hypothetical protein|nr:hypothetical protein [Lentisphaerota bacterium]MBT5605517.1 hypothetical protein [Lentisphaerota bacterium]MBT7097515.1 hypothetical protein [Candidatus Poribacteria bacterium]